jgi:hypothetical protein
VPGLLAPLSDFDVTPSRHHFPRGVIQLFIEFVLSGGAALRSASRLLAIVQQELDLPIEVPHWSTGRSWLLRLGYWKLVRPKVRADDWVWLVDHSAQIGEEKCLVILGVRLSQLPPAGQCLRHEDLEPIEVLPVTKSNQDVVYQQLMDATAKTGIPRAVVEDHGSDLHAGVRRFCQEHKRTVSVYDIKHKAATVLKRQLENDPRWRSFSKVVGETKFSVQQTEISFLVPPSQRSKARFMNLGNLIGWGQKTLTLLDAPPAVVREQCSPERLEEKLGWLREYRQELTEWSNMQAVIDTVVGHVSSHGLYRGASEALKEKLGPLSGSDRSDQVRADLLEFVAAESNKVDPGERLPGSTTVLESCFGKLKYLEREQSKSGFTGLLLSLGALVSKTTREVVDEALTATRTNDVIKWCEEKLGQTLQAKRRKAYSDSTKRNKSGMKLNWA